MRHIHSLLQFCLFTFFSLILMEGLYHIEMKSQYLKNLVYLGVLILPITLIIWGLIRKSSIQRKVLRLILPIGVLSCISLIGITRFAFSLSTWKTQTILYQNTNDSSRTIEFQMKDMGALGYRRRTVMVDYYTPLFIIASPIPPNVDSNNEWTKVHIDVNEVGLKGG